MKDDAIHIKGAHEHNLKGWDVDIPLNKISVITGPSGSGKTSLALHTLYAEGQRRYVETFSPYVRQFLERMGRPQVESIEPIPPALALEQTNRVRTSRSTVGTMTELTEYWKFVFSHLATGRNPKTGEIVKPMGADEASSWIRGNLSAGQEIIILFPVEVPQEVSALEVMEGMLGGGFLRYLWKGKIRRSDDSEFIPWEKGSPSAPKSLKVIQDRLKVPAPGDAEGINRLTEALDEALRIGKNKAFVATNDEKGWHSIKEFRNNWAPLLEPVPGLFSFNSPLGACPKCRGFGKIISVDMNRAINPKKTLEEGAVWIFNSFKEILWGFGPKLPSECKEDLLRCARKAGIPTDIPYAKLTEKQKKWVLMGEPGIDPSLFEDYDKILTLGSKWYGINAYFKWHSTHAHKMLIRMLLAYFRRYDMCPACHGDRLRPEALCFRVGEARLPDLMQMPVSKLLPWVEKYVLAPVEGGSWDGSMSYVAREIHSRLAYLDDVGLGYLTLDRATKTLSGGEVERVNLTLSLGSSLTNTLFVLDEPTVGLHPRDTGRLISIMRRLRDRGNTLAVVEHEEAVMRAADWIVDLGPESGDKGGEKLYSGPIDGLKNISASQTGAFLFGNKRVPLPSKRRKFKKTLKLRGAAEHNVRDLDVDIPLGVMTCLTGVSGSGKSTLAYNILYLNAAKFFEENIEEEAGKIKSLKGLEEVSGVYLVDQSPIMRTPRSTPSIYVKAFDSIRALFAATEEAKSNGIPAGYFSFNSGDGRCPRCSGCGAEKIEMQFLSDVFVPCAECEGKRYTREALKYHLNGKNMYEVLEMSISQAIDWFREIPGAKAAKVVLSLDILQQVGLGHLRLGQPLNTLSGGENQRLKLAGIITESGALKKNSKKQPVKGKLLLLDEPSTGLHFSDIEVLLKVFDRLVEAGHSLLVIEHNTEIIKCADYIIDLGPEGGDEGGRLVALGTPEEIATNTDSITGRYLKPLLSPEKAHLLAVEDSLPEKADWIQDVGPAPEVRDRFSQDTSWVSLRGARYHNLKSLNVDIPLGEMTVLSGLSGSGKSSLAFGIFFDEGQRRFLDVMSPYARQFTEQRERPERDCLIGLPPTVAIEQNVSRGGSKSTVGTVTEVWDFFRLLYAKLGDIWCPKCGKKAIQLTRSQLAEKATELAKKQKKFTLMAPLVRGRKGLYTDLAEWAEKKGYEHLLVDGKWVETRNFTPLDRYKIHDIDLILGTWTKSDHPTGYEWEQIVNRGLDYGKGVVRWENEKKQRGFLSTNRSCPDCGEAFDEPEPRLFSYNSHHGWCPTCRGHGVIKPNLKIEEGDSVLDTELRYDRAVEKIREEAEDSDEQIIQTCPACHGARLNEIARSARLQGMRVDEISSLPVSELHDIVSKWEFPKREAIIARDALLEITRRLHFLNTVGLDYLQMNRSVMTLSGGELQRIRLSAQLGSNLQGVFYVLDEPTIGLHPRDNARLMESLRELKERGNSLLVVEHDQDIMEQADWVIDLGPGAGSHGGEIIAQGTLADLMKNDHSVTGKALNNPPIHPIRGERRPLPSGRSTNGWIKLAGASANNLKNINAQFALERLNLVTGVSGAGKTSLVTGVLEPAAREAILDKRPLEKTWKTAKGFDSFKNVYRVDQTPIGRTPRSTPGTYVGFFDEIRTLFASTPAARQKGFTASRFSFNTANGRCEACKGNGMIKWEMDFLPPSYKTCEICQGKRYNTQTLEVMYNGKTIADILSMNIEDAVDFFHAVPKVRDALALLRDTGLGYLTLGQSSATLSGGEAQRLKLVTELIKGQNSSRNAKLKGRTTPKALYLIEEPSIGLHPLDVRRLIDVLHRLVDQGNTVVVIEHHLEIVAEADYIIDLGPEAGEEGGSIVTTGTPEDIASSGKGHTSAWLSQVLP